MFSSIVAIFLLFISSGALSQESCCDHTDTDRDAKSVLHAFTGLKTDIPIGEIDGIELSINIALPAEPGSGPRPVMLLIHGGGLIKGNKDEKNAQISSLAKRGIVAASAMYRLAPEYRFPTAIVDVKAAIRFLKAHALELNLDPNRIILWGSSSGGYLATMAGVTGNAPDFPDHGLYADFDSSVRGVIAQSPHNADFTLPKYRDFPIVDRFLNTHTSDRQTALEEISPITYLDKGDPPFFLAHGDADKLVPVDMTRDFVQALEAIEHTYTYIEVEGGGHSLNETRPDEAPRVFRESLDFFISHTRP